jgi:hypothetical protein
MKIIDRITIEELRKMSEKMWEPLVKGVVDIKLRLLVVDAGLHSDEELLLLEQGSEQADIWGFNLWPEDFDSDDFIEFDSMINIRPSQNNRSRGVEAPEIRDMIRSIVLEKIDE